MNWCAINIPLIHQHSIHQLEEHQLILTLHQHFLRRTRTKTRTRRTQIIHYRLVLQAKTINIVTHHFQMLILVTITHHHHHQQQEIMIQAIQLIQPNKEDMGQ